MSSWQAGEVTLTSIDHGGHEDDTSVMTAKQAGKDILFGSVRPLYSPDVDLAHPTVFYHGDSLQEWWPKSSNIHLTWQRCDCKRRSCHRRRPQPFISTDRCTVSHIHGTKKDYEVSTGYALNIHKTRAELIFSQGLPAPIVGSMAETAALFLAYSTFQNMIRSFSPSGPLSNSAPLSIPQLTLAAAGAGFVTSFVLYVVSRLLHVQRVNLS